MYSPIDPRSVLFVTLDSCRFDTMAAGNAPNIKRVGPLHKAAAPSYFTYGSHAAMFVGFTPGIATERRGIVNPKFAKLFRLAGPGAAGRDVDGFTLEGRSIVDGFRRAGYLTIGTGAVDWFDTETEPGRILGADFEEFRYFGNYTQLGRQLDWIDALLADRAQDRPVFVFLNVGETHIPYWFEGAGWDREDNPCVPFQSVDRSADCRLRQAACLTHVDAMLAPLLERFRDATTLVCADHGDCWGEDGLWAHGMSHPMTLTVPLLVRLRGVPL
jgi:hypothetical protein